MKEVRRKQKEKNTNKMRRQKNKIKMRRKIYFFLRWHIIIIILVY